MDLSDPVTCVQCGATVYSGRRPPGGYWTVDQLELIDRWYFQQQGPHEDTEEAPLNRSIVFASPCLHRAPSPPPRSNLGPGY